jgi:hypothetical protein
LSSRIILFLILPLLWTCATAQENSEQEKVSLKNLLIEWQHDNGFEYSGRDDLLSQCLVPNLVQTIDELSKHLGSCKLTYELSNGIYVFKSRASSFFISGVVSDSKTDEPVPHVVVQFEYQGTLTNEYGQFILNVPDTAVSISLSHMAYGQTIHRVIDRSENLISLELQNFKLNEVTVSDKTKGMNTGPKDEYEELLQDGRVVDARFFRDLETTLSNDHDTTLNLKMTAKKKRFGIYYNRLDVDRLTGKEVGKVYGFTDGINTYINPDRPRLRKQVDFFLTEELGNFLHYKVIQRIYFPVAGGAPAMVSFPAEKLLDIETGKSRTLTRGWLKKMIADDEELLNAFREEKKKSKKLKLYLQTYFDRSK